MVWFRVDDNLAFHQKTLIAGNPAMGLWVRAGAWCAQQLTDGYLPSDIAETLGTRGQAQRLVLARLWIERDGGYEFWQWAEDGRQPLRSQVEAERKDSRERQRHARERAKSRRDDERDSRSDSQRDTSVSHAVSNGGSAETPTRPVPKEQKQLPSSTKVDGPSADQLESLFAAFWTIYPKKVAKDAAKRRYTTLVLRGIDPAEILEGARRYAATRRGEDPQFTKQPDGWLNAGRWSDETAAATAAHRPTGWEHGAGAINTWNGET
jgi:hypothetical protein